MTSSTYSSTLSISTERSFPPSLSSISVPGRVKSRVRSETVAPRTSIDSIDFLRSSSFCMTFEPRQHHNIDLAEESRTYLSFISLEGFFRRNIFLEMRKRFAKVGVDELCGDSHRSARIAYIDREAERTLTEATERGRSCSRTSLMKVRLKLTSIIRESIIAEVRREASAMRSNERKDVTYT